MQQTQFPLFGSCLPSVHLLYTLDVQGRLASEIYIAESVCPDQTTSEDSFWKQSHHLLFFEALLPSRDSGHRFVGSALLIRTFVALSPPGRCCRRSLPGNAASAGAECTFEHGLSPRRVDARVQACKKLQPINVRVGHPSLFNGSGQGYPYVYRRSRRGLLQLSTTGSARSREHQPQPIPCAPENPSDVAREWNDGANGSRGLLSSCGSAPVFPHPLVRGRSWASAYIEFELRA
jgi:hypothetical protein